MCCEHYVRPLYIHNTRYVLRRRRGRAKESDKVSATQWKSFEIERNIKWDDKFLKREAKRTCYTWTNSHASGPSPLPARCCVLAAAGYRGALSRALTVLLFFSHKLASTSLSSFPRLSRRDRQVGTTARTISCAHTQSDRRDADGARRLRCLYSTFLRRTGRNRREKGNRETKCGIEWSSFSLSLFLSVPLHPPLYPSVPLSLSIPLLFVEVEIHNSWMGSGI